MSHFLTSDDKFRDLLYGDDYRAYLMARSQSADGYRFGRTRRKRARIHARNALRRVTGYFRNKVPQAFADRPMLPKPYSLEALQALQSFEHAKRFAGGSEGPARRPEISVPGGIA